jgi:hypothetical protein
MSRSADHHRDHRGVRPVRNGEVYMTDSDDSTERGDATGAAFAAELRKREQALAKRRIVETLAKARAEIYTAAKLAEEAGLDYKPLQRCIDEIYRVGAHFDTGNK